MSDSEDNKGAADTAAETDADASIAPASGAPTSDTPTSGAGFNLPVLAGVVLLAALLGAVLSYGLQTLLGANDNAALEARVDALEVELAAVADSADTSELRQGVSQLRRRVDRLEGRAAGPGPELASNIDGLSRQLTDVQSRTALLEANTPEDLAAQLEAFASEAEVSGLAERIALLEANELRNDMRRAAMALGLAQLSRAARGSLPFEVELAAVQRLRPDDPALDSLAPFAATGAPTLDMLRASYPAAARNALRAADDSGERQAWGRVWSWLTQSVSFRRTGEIEGTSTGAILARAELRLEERNLEAAIAELRTLDGGAAAGVDPWLSQAESRHNLDQLIADLSSDVIGELQQ